MYDVRVQRDGTVQWKGGRFVALQGEATAKISLDEAARLLKAFQGPMFWSACQHYSARVTDNPTYYLSADIAGMQKRISDYANAAPEEIHHLEMLVDEIADTHRWRVGDPKTETIQDIQKDAYLPKPGRTELMRLAATGTKEEVRAALAAGYKLTDVDSSGWTPLMYAASSRYGENIKLLLDRGASVKTRGPKGETALMFSAIHGQADSHLLAARADVNAKMSDGTTVLMLLVQQPDIDEVMKLLRAGADAKAKDNEGRTALDYLEAVNCGYAILPEPSSMTLGSETTCHSLYKESYDAVRRALQRAGARQTRVWYPAQQIDIVGR